MARPSSGMSRQPRDGPRGTDPDTGQVIGRDRRNMPWHWPGAVMLVAITGPNLPLAGWPGEGGDPSPAHATAGITAWLPPQRAAKGEIPVGPRNPGWRSAAGLAAPVCKTGCLQRSGAWLYFTCYRATSRQAIGEDPARSRGGMQEQSRQCRCLVNGHQLVPRQRWWRSATGLFRTWRTLGRAGM